MTDALLLREQDRQEILRLLARHLPDVTAWAYGSRVNGGAHEGSDLDIVLRSPDLSPIPLEELRAFVQALRDSNIPILVEARDWARLPESFQREIMKNYVVLRETVSEDYPFVPNGWEIKTIGEIAEKVTDGAHQSPKPCEKGRYMCSVKDMTCRGFDFSNSKKISEDDFDKLVKQGCCPQKNDILISKDGANCLDIIFVYNHDEEIVLLSSIAIIRLYDNYCYNYVRYFLLSPECQYVMRNSFISGSDIPRVVLKDFKRVPILLPLHKEQKAIASVLSSLDDKIDLLHRQNKTLEAMAEALFRQWFVEEAGEDWEDGKIEDLFVLQRGFDLPSHVRNEGHFPVYAASGLNGFHDEYKIKAPGVTTGRSGLLGKVFFVQDDFWPLNTSLFIKEFERATPLFAYFLLKNIDLEAFNSGSAVPSLNRNHVHNYELIIPPKDLIDKFESVTIGNFLKIKANQKQIRTLEQLRDTLLPKLMSGEVRVTC